jgi:alanine-alpha-ketoisovalerate/valine-pyruvate aminotransferase
MYSASNMNRLPQCDSYFVESDADMYAAEAQRRQYEKLIKSQRQDLMADELTMDVRRQYQDDIVAHMLFMEVCDSKKMHRVSIANLA